MNTDIRLSVSFTDHPKTVKLSRRLGSEAVICLIRLFGWIAQNKPLGLLSYATSNATSITLAMLKNQISEDVEIAAKWEGEPNLFFTTLLELKFIDETKKGISVHDWEEHNPYAFHANDRKNKAKKAAEARWSKDNSSNATSIPQALPPASSSNAPSPDPDPDPDPDPKDQVPLPPKKKKPTFSLRDKKFAEYMFSLIQKINPSAKKPNFESWANEVRLMREVDNRIEADIQSVFEWANSDSFWRGNILSPAKLRKQFDQLIIKSQERKNDPHQRTSSQRVSDKLNEIAKKAAARGDAI